ncbi:shikimate 5-dehydrogenase [compost metagenome]
MSPHIDTYPEIPYQYLTEKHVGYDLVYNPDRTYFLKQIEDRGGKVKNGLEMLHLQAIRSWEIWNA